MTIDEAYRHIKASYIHHANERNAIFLPQAELIAMECMKKIMNSDVQPVVDTENMATVSDEFICKKCGIYLKDYIKVVMDEDNDGYIDEQHYEYEPKFCPECGAKVKDGDNNAENNGSNHK